MYSISSCESCRVQEASSVKSNFDDDDVSTRALRRLLDFLPTLQAPVGGISLLSMVDLRTVPPFVRSFSQSRLKQPRRGSMRAKPDQE